MQDESCFILYALSFISLIFIYSRRGQNSWPISLWQPVSLFNFHSFLWQLKHLEITFSSMEDWFFFFPLALAIRVIRILISETIRTEKYHGEKKNIKYSPEQERQRELDEALSLDCYSSTCRSMLESMTLTQHCLLDLWQCQASGALKSTFISCHSEWNKVFKALQLGSAPLLE